MQPKNPFRASIVALITPFTNSGRIDFRALESLVQWHVEEKTDGIVCCGTTGEGSSLSSQERKKIIQTCVDVAAGKMPIIAGTGTCDTKQTFRLTEDARKAGAAGCLVVTPYYNKPTQKGCLAHFREVAKVGLPLIVYHNPGRAIFRFQIDSIKELGEIPGIVALKESSHDLDFIRACRKISSIDVLSGDCDLTYEILAEGGAGSISVIGNVVPGGWGKMVRLALSKEWTNAKKLADLYLPLAKGNFIETNPQCVKWILSQMGKCLPLFRLPLLSPTCETQDRLKKILLRLSMRHLNFDFGNQRIL